MDKNTIDTSTDGIYLYFESIDYLYEQADVTTGEVWFTGNVITSAGDGLYIEYSYIAYQNIDDAQLLMGDVRVENNQFTVDGEAIELYYDSYEIGSYSDGNAYARLPSHYIQGNTISTQSSGSGVYLDNYSNPDDTYGNALTEFGDLVVTENTFSGGDYGVYLYHEDVCEGCYEGSGATLGQIEVLTNTFTSHASNAVRIYFDEIGYEFDYTGTVTVGDILVAGNVITGTPMGIEVFMSDIQSAAQAAVAFGSLQVRENEIINASTYGIYAELYWNVYDDGTLSVLDTIIEDNTIFGASTYGIYTNLYWNAYNDGVLSALDTIIEDNTIFGCGLIGMQFNSSLNDSSSVPISVGDLYVSGNTLLGCIYNGMVLGWDQLDAFVFNNILADQGGNGIFVGEVDTAEIMHNTLVGMDTPATGGVMVDGGTVDVQNNIVAAFATGIYGTSGITVTEDYNLLAFNGAPTDGSVTRGGHSLEDLDPAFADPAGDDYHITLNSPAQDAGPDVGVDGDIDGDVRPQLGGYDLGADEIPLVAGLAFGPAGAVFAMPGETVTYTHHLTNTGNYTDTFTFSLTGSQGWPADYEPVSVTLGAGDVAQVLVRVTVPASNWGASVESTVITAISQNNSSVSASVANTTTTLSLGKIYLPAMLRRP